MSTWQIRSDDGNRYRWEVSGEVIPGALFNQERGGSSSPGLPSAGDLLRQGCSKLLENGDGKGTMFRTGSGKAVPLKGSSIAKAISVLGDDNKDRIPGIAGGVSDGGDSLGLSSSLFQTGSGKSVSISSAGLVRAKTLLGTEIDGVQTSSQAFQCPRKSPGSNEERGFHSPLKKGRGNGNVNGGGGLPVSMPPAFSSSSFGETKSQNEVNAMFLQPEICDPGGRPPPIKFQTAGGRSLSVSSDALQRARSLLGDPDLGGFLNDIGEVDPAFVVLGESRCDGAFLDKKDGFSSAFTHPVAAKSKFASKTFISPLKSSAKQAHLPLNLEAVIVGSNLMNKFNAVQDGGAHRLDKNLPPLRQQISKGSIDTSSHVDNSAVNVLKSTVNLPATQLPLADISNTVSHGTTNFGQNSSEKKRTGRGRSITTFKKPRSSKFTAPLNKNISAVPDGLSASSENSIPRTVSSRYPFHGPRMYIKEYLTTAPLVNSRSERGADNIRCIKPENADRYMFPSDNGINSLGVEDFWNMLIQSGASSQYASKEWVSNHYKWIVWKLASYERCRPAKLSSKLLTVFNVLEELKYRYEREFNHGHRSALKRILEGDAQSSLMLVLCISAVHIRDELNVESHPVLENGNPNDIVMKIELTDGWYAVGALLDVPLSKHLASGKLFIGQKLRIRGAGLLGCAGPTTPLEALNTTSLKLHINGTYRAHWADRLGFCKDGVPLAFRCIRSDGGPVPQTLLGVTRIYPVLYKEKLSTGEAIVRSERMEAKMIQLHNQRRSAMVEGILSDYQIATKSSNSYQDTDSEGAEIFRVLERAAEPEILMAEMSSEQLSSFASYQAKREAVKQLDMEKTVEKALRDAALGDREVTPFMRVRVVGLTSYEGKGITKEGIITIWNPTEKQQNHLVEGQAYIVEGLVPVNSNGSTLYLQARGLTTKWQLLSPSALHNFLPFYNPRMSTLLANLAQLPLSSEFDIATLVLHVGEVHLAAQQKKQWVFVIDSSVPLSQYGEATNSLLAISFCSPSVDDESFAPINYNLAGSVVGFCNLIKRAKDPINQLWIADATENSTYDLSFDTPKCSHLREAAFSLKNWAKNSSLIIDQLKQKVQFIIGDNKS